jgi:hypothetical protein
LFDLSNDHLTTRFLRLLYNITLSNSTKKPPVPKLNKINTCSNCKLFSQFLGLLLLLCQLHSAEGLITQSKPYKKFFFKYHFSEIQGLLKDFQAPILFSSTFKAFKPGKLNSRTFKDSQGPVATLHHKLHHQVLAFGAWQNTSVSGYFRKAQTNKNSAGAYRQMCLSCS